MLSFDPINIVENTDLKDVLALISSEHFSASVVCGSYCKNNHGGFTLKWKISGYKSEGCQLKGKFVFSLSLAEGGGIQSICVACMVLYSSVSAQWLIRKKILIWKYAVIDFFSKTFDFLENAVDYELRNIYK